MRLTTYVISLDEGTLNSVDELKGSLNIQVERHPGVLAATSRRWTEKGTLGNFIGPGAAGCLLAHKEAWATWLSKTERMPSDYLLVLEADARLTKYGQAWFPFVLDVARRHNFDLLQLGSHRTGLGPTVWRDLAKPSIATQRVFDYVERSILNVSKPRFSPSCEWGTYAYLISRKCAEWMAAEDFGFRIPIDSWFRSLSQVPSNSFFRCRQQLWTADAGASLVTRIGR